MAGIGRRLRPGLRAAPLNLGAPGARRHSRVFIKMPARSSNDLGRRAGSPSPARSAAPAPARTWGAPYGRRGLPATGCGRAAPGKSGEALGARMGFADGLPDPQERAWPLHNDNDSRSFAPESEAALVISQTSAALGGRCARWHAQPPSSHPCLCLPSLSQAPGCTPRGSRKDSMEVCVLLVA